MFYLFSHFNMPRTFKKSPLIPLISSLSSPLMWWCRTWGSVSLDSMDSPCVLRNNGHPSHSEDAWLNGAQTGDTVQCSGPFPFDSHSTGDGMTPMRRLLSPGGSERCSSAVSGQGSEETLLCPVGWAGKTDAHGLAHLLCTHTLSWTLCTLGASSPLSRKFQCKQLLGVRGVTGLFQVPADTQRRSGLTVMWNYHSGWGSVLN